MLPSGATNYVVVMSDPEVSAQSGGIRSALFSRRVEVACEQGHFGEIREELFSCLHEKRADNSFADMIFGASRCITVRDDDSVKIKNKVKTLGLPQLRMERTAADRSSRREVLIRRSSRS